VLARFSDDLAYGTHEANFNLFILSIIVLAGVVVGLQTYPSMAEDKGIGYVAARLRTLPLPPLLFRPPPLSTHPTPSPLFANLSSRWLNLVILIIFVFEVFFKITAMGLTPLRYVERGRWRCCCYYTTTSGSAATAAAATPGYYYHHTTTATTTLLLRYY